MTKKRSSGETIIASTAADSGAGGHEIRVNDTPFDEQPALNFKNNASGGIYFAGNDDTGDDETEIAAILNIDALPNKATPIDADKIAIGDSEDSWNPKEITLSQLSAVVASGVLKTRLTQRIVYRNKLVSSGTFNTGTLPTGYDWFEVLVRLRATPAATNDTAYMWYNGSSTATDYRSSLSGASGGSASNGIVNTPRIGIIPAANSPANSFSVSKITIRDPDLTMARTVIAEDASQLDSTTSQSVYKYVHYWNQTNPITSIQIAPDGAPTDTFAAGSEIVVIGYKEEEIGGGGQSGGVVDGALPSTCEGRLTLETTVPVSTTDQTAKTSVYFCPYKGNVISLYDGADWQGYSFSEKSLSLSGFGVHRLYDIFAYHTGSDVALESVAWNAPTNGTITNVTNANPPVVSDASHTLVVGDIVTISGVVGATGVNGTFRVSAISAGVSFTLQTLAAANPGAPGAYSSGGVWVKKYSNNTRATALSTQDGIIVKSGDATRRYLGTICITNVAGQCEDSAANRLMFNYYNRIEQNLYAPDATWNAGYASTWRAMQNDFGNMRLEVVVGVAEEAIEVSADCTISIGANNTSGVVAIGYDSISAPMAGYATSRVGVNSAIVIYGSGMVSARIKPTIGHHYFQMLQHSLGGTPSFHSLANELGRILGKIQM